MADGALLILAAGNSSRLGRSKQLLQLKPGITLLNRIIELALKSQLGDVYTVLGADFERHRKSINLTNSINIIENKNWQEGIGSSLKKGLSYILEVDQALKWVIISVCDQPYLTTNSFVELAKTYNQNQSSIVASRYDAQNIGVPVLFSKNMFDKLLALDNSAGALQVIKKNLKQTSFVAFNKGHIDIDTLEDVRDYLS